MSLYYIDGVSGSGKSKTLEALRSLGYDAYDVDEAGPVTAKWHNTTTGFVHPKSSVKAAQRTPEFLAVHAWKISRSEVEALAKQAVSVNVFLGGAVTNLPELRDLFSLVFALSIDDATMAQRLTSRTNNNWGKSPHELERSLVANQQARSCYETLGYTVIDAARPTNVIVYEILDHVEHN